MNGLTKWHLDTFFGIEFYCWKILWMRVKNLILYNEREVPHNVRYPIQWD